MYKYLFLVLFLRCTSATGRELIKCACSTSQCKAQNETSCSTRSMCYSQYLERNDGTDPTVRGCIIGKTPLLCENRRPSAVTNSDWPILSCCSTNMCNSNHLKVQSQTSRPIIESNDSNNYIKQHREDNEISSSKDSMKVSLEQDKPYAGVLQKNVEELLERSLQQNNNKSKEPSNPPQDQMSISPIYISVLVIGVLSLIVIGTIAIYVLRRHNNGLRNTDYRVVKTDGFVKGTNVEDGLVVCTIHSNNSGIVPNGTTGS